MKKSECIEIGRQGQRIVAEALRARGIRTQETDDSHPFDVLCLDETSAPMIAIEVKWLGPKVLGTRISKRSRLRKEKWARENGVHSIYTLIVRNDKIGWMDGLVNRAHYEFDDDVDALVGEMIIIAPGVAL